MNERDDLADAERAERAGDPMGAALALRRHLERHPGDGVARLRFARVLIAAGEHGAARQALAPLEAQLEKASRRKGAEALPGLPSERDVERALAELDEADGAVASAAARWERLLADDIDDAQARARLARLRPASPSPPRQSDRAGTAETLVSPEGVETLRYRLVREIGRGATATVYLARDEALDLSVALKILHPQLAATRRTEPLGRFLAGARLLAGLRHPGVVAVYDVDEPARALAMEWIAGGTLRARLATHPDGLPADELAATARGLLATLAFLHGQGIVHGDLKPSNLLLRDPGRGRAGRLRRCRADRPRRRRAPRRGGRHAALPGAGAVSGSPRLRGDGPLCGGRNPLGGRHRTRAPEPRGPPPARPAGGCRRRAPDCAPTPPRQPRLFWLFLIRTRRQGAGGGLGRRRRVDIELQREVDVGDQAECRQSGDLVDLDDQRGRLGRLVVEAAGRAGQERARCDGVLEIRSSRLVVLPASG